MPSPSPALLPPTPSQPLPGTARPLLPGAPHRVPTGIPAVQRRPRFPPHGGSGPCQPGPTGTSPTTLPATGSASAARRPPLPPAHTPLAPRPPSPAADGGGLTPRGTHHGDSTGGASTKRKRRPSRGGLWETWEQRPLWPTQRAQAPIGGRSSLSTLWCWRTYPLLPGRVGAAGSGVAVAVLEAAPRFPLAYTRDSPGKCWFLRFICGFFITEKSQSSCAVAESSEPPRAGSHYGLL